MLSENDRQIIRFYNKVILYVQMFWTKIMCRSCLLKQNLIKLYLKRPFNFTHCYNTLVDMQIAA